MARAWVELMKRLGYSQFAALMGHTGAGIAAARRTVTLDPLNPDSHVARRSLA
jgi:hypothetical protein